MRSNDVSRQTEILLDEYRRLTGQTEDWNQTLSIDEFLTFRKAAIYEVEKKVVAERPMPMMRTRTKEIGSEMTMVAN